MDINTIDLNNINLGDENFDNDGSYTFGLV